MCDFYTSDFSDDPLAESLGDNIEPSVQEQSSADNWEAAVIISGQDLPESSNSQSDPSYYPSMPHSELPLSQADFPFSAQEMQGVLEEGKPVSANELRERLSAATSRSTETAQRAASRPELAQEVLARLTYSTQGWCRLSTLKPTKKNGYIQVSWQGFNKFAVLQDVVLWAAGYRKRGGEDASHLCDQPTCIVPGHVVPESHQANNDRKGCLGAILCSSNCSRCDGKKYLLVCTHDPPCVRYIEGYTSQQDFLDNGICESRVEDARKRRRLA